MRAAFNSPPLTSLLSDQSLSSSNVMTLRAAMSGLRQYAHPSLLLFVHSMRFFRASAAYCRFGCSSVNRTEYMSISYSLRNNITCLHTR